MKREGSNKTNKEQRNKFHYVDLVTMHATIRIVEVLNISRDCHLCICPYPYLKETPMDIEISHEPHTQG